jgi:CRISPR-associated protein Cas5d
MRGEERATIALYADDERQQRASLVLRNVGYVIEAHFDVVERTLEAGGQEVPEEICAAKHISIFNRRVLSGQAFHQPYLGCREFPAHFALIAEGDPLPSCELPEDQRNKDFGWMFHDFIYREDKKGKIIESNKGHKLTAEPRFFYAKAENGVICIPSLEGKEVVA